MNIESKPVVLVAPLNWGIGHAARVVPVIKMLIEKGFEVIPGISGLSGEFLKNCFPELNFVRIPAFNIRYGRRNIFLWLIFQLPFFLFSVVREHYILKRIIQKHQVGFVISDNRYGLWNKKVFSVLITHQVFIKMPAGLNLIQKALHRCTFLMIEKFDECWIPDFQEETISISGELSHGEKLIKKCRYVGLLSRFSDLEISKTTVPERFKVLVILSGPEPQRTIFENKLTEELIRLKAKAFVLRGLPGFPDKKKGNGYITFMNHVNDSEFAALVYMAETIICRAGYSTIMDLLALGRKALLVPTPGQTEQEYLAEYLSNKGYFLSIPQHCFDLALAFEALKEQEIQSYKLPEGKNLLLIHAIDNLKHRTDIL